MMESVTDTQGGVQAWLAQALWPESGAQSPHKLCNWLLASTRGMADDS